MDSKNINKINRFLIILLSLIFLCIILVSLFYFLTSSSNNQNKYRKIDNPTEIKNSVGYSVFSDFGRLRTFTLDNPQIPIVINPFLSYKTENTFLYEELCQKQRKIKSIILQYFNQKTKEQLFLMGENQIKEEILNQINAELSMGSIQALYFEEYIFLE